MMRKVYCFIVLLFVVGSSFAQGPNGTSNKDTSGGVKAIDAKSLDKNKEYFFVIDGVIFKGKITQINSADIVQMVLLNPPGSTNIYGEQGRDGAILVTTIHQKVYSHSDTSKIGIGGPKDTVGKKGIPPLVLLDGNQYTGDITKIDARTIAEVNVVMDTAYTKKYGNLAMSGIIFITTRGHQNTYIGKTTDTLHNTPLPDSAIYVIDGEVSEKKLDGIAPQNILSINVLKKGKEATPTGIDPYRDIVIVVTKAGATKSYQKKLGTISFRYKKYLDNHNGDDSGLIYMVDGIVCDKGQTGLEMLYQLPKDKIAKVALSEKKGVISVKITTKK
jgi:hypothetical protein